MWLEAGVGFNNILSNSNLIPCDDLFSFSLVFQSWTLSKKFWGEIQTWTCFANEKRGQDRGEFVAKLTKILFKIIQIKQILFSFDFWSFSSLAVHVLSMQSWHLFRTSHLLSQSVSLNPSTLHLPGLLSLDYVALLPPFLLLFFFFFLSHKCTLPLICCNSVVIFQPRLAHEHWMFFVSPHTEGTVSGPWRRNMCWKWQKESHIRIAWSSFSSLFRLAFWAHNLWQL